MTFWNKYIREIKSKATLATTLYLLFGVTCLGQNPVFEKLGQIPLKASGIEADKLGNLYSFHNETITKLSPAGEQLRTDSFKKFGEIHAVDVSNPLKIMVFFEELLQIIFLDNELGMRGDALQLDFMGYPQTAAACMSYDNGIWVFDKSTYKLARLSENLRVTNSTSNLMQIIGSEINPVKMFESNNQLYLADPEQGVFIFDLFGTYYRKIPVSGILSLDFFGNSVYFQTQSEIIVYREDTGDIKHVPAPEPDIKYMAVHKNKIYLLGKESLHIFKVNL